ncbi:MAG: hypothetical protein OXL68_01210 [Paracoccaceae bacterium]|nr:hypothetical protein [Paracoccaceae bacterium]
MARAIAEAIETCCANSNYPVLTNVTIAHCRELISAREASTDYNKKIDFNRKFCLAFLLAGAMAMALKIVDDQCGNITCFARIHDMSGRIGLYVPVQHEHAESLEAVNARETWRVFDPAPPAAGVSGKVMHMRTEASDRAQREESSRPDMETGVIATKRLMFPAEGSIAWQVKRAFVFGKECYLDVGVVTRSTRRFIAGHYIASNFPETYTNFRRQVRNLLRL